MTVKMAAMPIALHNGQRETWFLYYYMSVHTTPQLRCRAAISITSLLQVTAASPHFQVKINLTFMWHPSAVTSNVCAVWQCNATQSWCSMNGPLDWPQSRVIARFHREPCQLRDCYTLHRKSLLCIHSSDSSDCCCDWSQQIFDYATVTWMLSCRCDE